MSAVSVSAKYLIFMTRLLLPESPVEEGIVHGFFVIEEDHPQVPITSCTHIQSQR
jgi:hypothetical protein